MLSLSSQEGSTRPPLLAEPQQTSYCSLDLFSVTEHVAQTAQPRVFSPPSSIRSGPFHGASAGKQPSPVSSAECAYPPTFTHTHAPRVAHWLLSGDGSRGDTALPRPQPVGEPHPALPALKRPLPSSPTPSLDGPPSHHGSSSRVLEPQAPLPARMEAKCDSVSTGYDHEPRVHFDRGLPAEAQTTRLTQIETQQQKPGAGLTPWKPSLL